MSFWYQCNKFIFSKMWYKNQVHTPTFWDMTICVWNLAWFLWKCDSKKSTLNIFYSKQHNHNLNKQTNKKVWDFCGKKLINSQKLHLGEKRHIRYVKKQKASNSTDGSFFTPMKNFHILNMLGLCDLFPVHQSTSLKFQEPTSFEHFFLIPIPLSAPIFTSHTKPSSVACPICQEGKSERTFPIFAFSSPFFLFSNPPLFLIIGSFFAGREGHSAPLWSSPVYMPLHHTVFIARLKES